ncbi:hypothetical protein MW887_000155 [Aspergillus wentii]|nr:hypothetical protein MW887_000155 [Aspergillus wentii]
MDTPGSDPQCINSEYITRLTERINRLNALTDNSDEQFDEPILQNGDFGFPLLASPRYPDEPNIMQDAFSIMQEVDPSRAIFETRLRPTIPKTSTAVPLPPREEMQRLLDVYFEHFNPIFPLFQQDDFRGLVDRIFNRDSSISAGSGACVYAVIALSYKLQLWYRSTPEKVAASWFYFNAATRLLPEISVGEDNLDNIQALALMTIFLQGSMQFNNASNLLGTAIRQTSSFDLHSSSASDQELISNIWRVLFVLDKECSLHSGLPPMIKSDFTRDLPFPSTCQSSLRHYYSLAQIEEQIYQDLYSGEQQTDPEQLLDIAWKLDHKLISWKNQLPPQILSDFNQPSKQYFLLHLMYNNSLMTVHRLPAIHCPYTGLLSRIGPSSNLTVRIGLSAEKRIESACSSIHLVQKLDLRSPVPFWLFPPHIIASVVLLLVTVILSEDSTQHHIEAIDSAVSFVELVNEKSGGEFRQMLRIASGTADIARKVSLKSKNDHQAGNVARVAIESAVRELHRGLKSRDRNRAVPRGRKRVGGMNDTASDFWWNLGSGNGTESDINWEEYLSHAILN